MTPSFADMIASACKNAKKQLQPPVGFFPKATYFRRYSESLYSDIMNAQRYIISDDVTEAAVDLGMQHPDILLAALRNAYSPFNSMWLEWSPRAQINAAIKNTGQEHYENAGDPADHTGVFVQRIGDTRYKIVMLGESKLETDTGEIYTGKVKLYGVSPLAIIYDIENPLYAGVLSSDEELITRFGNCSKQTLRSSLLAGAYAVTEEVEEVDENGKILSDREQQQIKIDRIRTRIEQCDNLGAHARYIFDPLYGHVFRDRLLEGPDRFDIGSSSRNIIFNHAEKTIAVQLREEAGIFRFIISVIALLMTNDRIVDQKSFSRSKGVRLGGKHVPFLEHRRVSLLVPRKTANARILRAISKSLPRAQHDVEGHWKQKRKGYDMDCKHVMVRETPKREVCAIHGCGFKRWHVDEFKRGDPSIGIIKKTRVTRLNRKLAPVPVTPDD